MENLKYKNKKLRHLISAPFILSCIVPIVIMDVWIEIYHRVAFPLYGLKCINRRAYVRIDRHKLKYLTFCQKIYCAYCGYGNGVINYWTQIAAHTEKYWCGIQHKKVNTFVSPKHHSEFAKYNDENDFKKKYLDK